MELKYSTLILTCLFQSETVIYWAEKWLYDVCYNALSVCCIQSTEQCVIVLKSMHFSISMSSLVVRVLNVEHIHLILTSKEYKKRLLWTPLLTLSWPLLNIPVSMFLSAPFNLWPPTPPLYFPGPLSPLPFWRGSFVAVVIWSVHGRAVTHSQVQEPNDVTQGLTSLQVI